MYFLSLAAFLILVIMLFIMTRRSTRGQVYIVIVHYVGDIVGDALRKAMGSSKYRIKSRTCLLYTSRSMLLPMLYIMSLDVPDADVYLSLIHI